KASFIAIDHSVFRQLSNYIALVKRNPAKIGFRGCRAPETAASTGKNCSGTDWRIWVFPALGAEPSGQGGSHGTHPSDGDRRSGCSVGGRRRNWTLCHSRRRP